MAHFWRPLNDEGTGLCGCYLQTDDGQRNLIKAHNVCPAHVPLRQGKPDAQFFEDLKNDHRIKSAARNVARGRT